MCMMRWRVLHIIIIISSCRQLIFLNFSLPHNKLPNLTVWTTWQDKIWLGFWEHTSQRLRVYKTPNAFSVETGQTFLPTRFSPAKQLLWSNIICFHHLAITCFSIRLSTNSNEKFIAYPTHSPCHNVKKMSDIIADKSRLPIHFSLLYT